MTPCSLALPSLTRVFSPSVGSSVRPLPTRLPPGAPVRGLSARTGPTVWTRAASLCASASRALAAPSVRSCLASTSWIGTLTYSSPTCRTGHGPTSHCRCVPRAPVTEGGPAAGDPGLRSEYQDSWEHPVLVKTLWMWVSGSQLELV